MDEIPDVEITVTVAGEGPTRKASPSAKCPFCDLVATSEQVIIRIWDFNRGPGIREHVIHKRCMQLLLDATIDDEESTTLERYVALGLDPHSGN